MKHTRVRAAVGGIVLAAAATTACSTDSGGSAAAPTASPSDTGTYAPADVAHEATTSPTTSPGATGTGPSATVTTKSVPLGTVLVNNRGRTLYVFQKDTTSTSTCTGTCAATWPPLLTSGKPAATGGVKSNLLSTSTRSGGAKQVTYNGHPLYMFSGDKTAGQTNGQGLTAFGAKWYVLGTNGKQITKTSSSASPTSGTSGGY
ncbi:COG4315 family predicted lipoprotein [Actinacidiphila acididurans]|uniref:Lipoprotein with Yx(FWY)xxD motif n=1 Tax=Actinacidiphila acididurans TaxID=2784346 RepID=A0ABS2TZA3_9ACTN|nr:hypothetical protein [Actinacidiphila acididurans]MBM9508654.1 hypothetical protein [Actinacidiphila acididurans]